VTGCCVSNQPGCRVDRKIPRNPASARLYLHRSERLPHFMPAKYPFSRSATSSPATALNPATNPLSTLSLVPMDNQPWKAQDEDERLARACTSPAFRNSMSRVRNWISAQIHSTATLLNRARSGATARTTPRCCVEKPRRGGLCLACDGQSKVQTRVGNWWLTNPSRCGIEWRLGTLRWLRCQTGTRWSSASCASPMRRSPLRCAPSQRGHSGEYFRALIASNGPTCARDVDRPAAMYDTGSILVLNSAWICLCIPDSVDRHQYFVLTFQFRDGVAARRRTEKIATIKSMRA